MSAPLPQHTRASRLATLLGCAAVLALGQAQSAAQAPAAAAGAPPASVASTAGSETGRVAWYGRRFAGRRTASGERFDPNALTMAHRSLPFGTRVKVTHVESGRSVEVRVNDRGPTQPDRIGDLSLAAARSLGMVRSGIAAVQLEVLP
jgi:rare lipoprotein A